MATSTMKTAADRYASRQPELTIIGMLGGSTCGKGTQCRLLSEKFNIVHWSVGEVLRKKVAQPGSPFGSIIRENMSAGRVGPKEITVTILKDYILQSVAALGTHVFILDGMLCGWCLKSRDRRTRLSSVITAAGIQEHKNLSALLVHPGAIEICSIWDMKLKMTSEAQTVQNDFFAQNRSRGVFFQCPGMFACPLVLRSSGC
ncbi:hypothetical protein V8F06_014776 [Rhypophila decipiens]